MDEKLEIVAYMKYLGKRTPIYFEILEGSKKNKVKVMDGNLVCQGENKDGKAIEKAVITFLKRETKKHVECFIAKYQKDIKIKPRGFKVDGDPTKWGTCNSNRELTFNFMLLMFPLQALEYVVVHELCHLKHMNHDRSFWRLVGKLMPNYKEVMALIHKDQREM